MSSLAFILHFLLLLAIISITLRATLDDTAKEITKKSMGCFVKALIIVLVAGILVYFIPYIFR